MSGTRSTRIPTRPTFDKIGRLGFLGGPIPNSTAARAWTTSASGTVREIERANMAFRVFLSVHVGLN